MKKIYSALIFVSVLTSSHLYAQCPLDSANIITYEYNDHIYQIVKENLNWEDASACAVARGGYLAEIKTAAEHAELWNQVLAANLDFNETVAPDGGGASYIWLGANDISTEGNWIWDGDNDGEGGQFWTGGVDGMAWSGYFINWGMEPDNFTNQDALGLAIINWPLGQAGQWNDIKQINDLFFVIEYDEEILSAVSELPKVNSGISIIPNPASQTILIESKAAILNVEINDVIGQSVLITESLSTIDISHLIEGIYFINANLNDGTILTKRLLILR